MATNRDSAARNQTDGTVLVGRKPVPAASPTNTLRLDPLADFVFLHHPHRWDVVLHEDKALLIPALRKFHFEPGVSGVHQVRATGLGNAAPALATLGERGWTVIDPNMEVKAWGKTEDGYVREFAGHRGPVHLDVWTKPYILGGQVVLDIDDAGFIEFRASLVAARLVPPCDKIVRKALQTRMRRAMIKRRTTETAQSIAASEVYEQKLAAFTVIDGGKTRASTPPNSSKED